MSANVDVIAVMTAAANDMAGVAEAEGHYFDDADVNGMYEAIAAVADLIESMRLIESAKDRGFGIDYARGVAISALARCKGGAA